MSEPLQKVQSGQRLRIPAAAYNAFVDAARDLRSRQQSRSQEIGIPQPDAAITVRVKNASGGDVPRFGVLGIDQPLFGPSANVEEFKNRVILQCSTPTVANHSGKFVVAAAPIANGQIGTAFIAGVFVAKLEITDASDTYADVKASAAELKSSSGGAAQILWKESGTGTGKWAIIRIGGPSGGGVGDSSVQILHITGNRTRGECYSAYPFIFSLPDLEFLDVSASGFTSVAMLGVDDTDHEVTAINVQQGDGATTHALTIDTQRLKLVIGYKLPFPDQANNPCYLIVAKDFRLDNC
jgi:hypothetical protein